MIKRAIDLSAALLGLIILSPVMAVVAVLIKRDSDGPVIFRQERIGKGGKPFTLLKFRSMSVTPQAVGPLITVRSDPRITSIGAALRSTKLDELPQLWNVVRGEMSLVGPRPEVAKYVETWSAHDRKIILSVRPGITDPATLMLRREESLLAGEVDPEHTYREVLIPLKTGLYRDYVLTQTLLGDLRILVGTAHRVILH